MGLSLITAPTAEAITLEQLKGHLRVTHDAEDGTLALYLQSAIEWVESYTGRKLITQTWRLTLNDFWHAELRLPFGLCSRVRHIRYYDGSGVQQTLTGPTSDTPGADYQEDLSSSEGGLISAPIDTDWPSVQSDRLGAVEIDFDVGYADPRGVPGPLRTGLLFRADDLYEFRGAADDGGGTELAKLQVDDWRIVRPA